MNANACRHCCHGCPTADRRGFLRSLAAAAVLLALPGILHAAEATGPSGAVTPPPSG